MYNLVDLLKKTIEIKASDLHLIKGLKPKVRVNGELIELGEEILEAQDTLKFAKEILKDEYDTFNNVGEIDLSYSIKEEGRFRVNIYKENGNIAIALRTIFNKIPTMDELKVPEVVKGLIKKQKGLILVTGSTGSGKSTTLAAMINEINKTSKAHIITLEDPIEYIHCHNKSIVNQREIGKDTNSYGSALRAALREDPDVILIGEMRDLETMKAAITAAETGHLVVSTLHTIGAAKTIDRIVDNFKMEQQKQIRLQLAEVLLGIVSQVLLPKKDGNGRVAAYEIMINTPAVQNLIREGRSHQINSIIETSRKYGMITMDYAIAKLFKESTITEVTAINNAVDEQNIKKFLF